MKKIIILLLLAVVILVSGCVQQQNQEPQPGANQTNTIIIKNFAFDPPTITVSAGTVVKWVNEDSAPHNIKSDSFNSANFNNGESFEFKFNNKGTYDYICGIHPLMKGKIIVE